MDYFLGAHNNARDMGVAELFAATPSRPRARAHAHAAHARPAATTTYHSHANAQQAYSCVRDEQHMCVMLVKSDTCPYSRATMAAVAELEHRHATDVPAHHMVVLDVPQVRQAVSIAKKAGDARITDILQHVYDNSKYVPLLVRLPAHRSSKTTLNAVVGSRDVPGLVNFIKHNK